MTLKDFIDRHSQISGATPFTWVDKLVIIIITSLIIVAISSEIYYVIQRTKVVSTRALSNEISPNHSQSETKAFTTQERRTNSLTPTPPSMVMVD